MAAERIVATNTEGLDANNLFKHARVGRAIAHIRTLLDSVDPELINLAKIENMNGLANTARSNAETYASTGNVGALDGIEAHVNDLYSYIRFLPIAPPDRVTAAAEEAVRSFTKVSINILNDAHAKNKILADNITSLERQVSEQQNKIDEANRIIEIQKSRLDQAIANNQSTFLQTEADRAKQFTEQSTKWENARQELIATETKNREISEKEREESNKRFIEELQGRADVVITEMKRLESDTRRIFGVVGNTTQSGEYRKAADRDASAANWLRVVALLLMGAMIFVGYLAFKHSLDHPEVDWKLFGFRLGTTLILAIPAVYAAQESAKHRQREQSNRRIHLELAAIDAYLELLPEQKKHEIKASLTDKFFGREEKFPEVHSKETSHAVLKILEEAVKNLTKPSR